MTTSEPNGATGSTVSRDPAVAVDPAARDHLALALDVDDAVAAQRMARELRPWFAVAKVGLELFSAAGPDIIQELIGDGYNNIGFIFKGQRDFDQAIEYFRKALALRETLPDKTKQAGPARLNF